MGLLPHRRPRRKLRRQFLLTLLMPPQNFPRPRNHLARQPRQSSHLNSIALVRAPSLHPPQKYNLVPRLLHRHMHIPHASQKLLQLRQLMIVRSKKRPRPRPRMQSLHHSPSNRQSVESSRPASDFIEQNQTSRGRRIQNRRHFAHLHQKSRPAPRQIIRSPNPREHPVQQRQFRRRRRHKRPHLRQNRNQSRLPQISGLAPHVRSSNQKQKLRLIIQIQIIRHEPLAALLQQLFNHRMPPARNHQNPALSFPAQRSLGKFRPRIIPRSRNPREIHQHVQLRDPRRNAPQPPRLPRNSLANFHVQPPLNLQHPLFRGQYFPFMLLQFRRSKPLRIHQSLLPLVVRRRQMQIRFRNLDIETENLVISNFQRPNPSPLPLALLHRSNNLPPLPRNIVQLIELRIESPPNHARIASHRRWIVRNPPRNHLPHISHFVQLLAQRSQPAAKRNRPHHQRRQQPVQHWNLLQRLPQRQQIPRRSHAQSNPASQPLQIQNPLKRPMNLLALHSPRFQFAHGIQTILNLPQRNLRTQNPSPQQPRPHPRSRLINRLQQSRRSIIPRRRFHQFQIPHSHRIQNHRILLLVISNAVQMLQASSRRPQRRIRNRIFRRPRPDRRSLAQVMHQRPRRGRRRRVPVQSKSFQSSHPKMLLQHPCSVIRLKRPFIQTRFHRPQPIHLRRQSHRKQSHRPRQKHFARPQNPQLIPQPRLRLLPRKLGSPKFPSRKIHKRQSNHKLNPAPAAASTRLRTRTSAAGRTRPGTRSRSAARTRRSPRGRTNRRTPRHRRQIIIFLSSHQPRAASRPRRQDPYHFPPHNFLPRPRHFHLLADRHLVPSLNQSRNIIFRRVIRHPAHRHRLPLLLIPRRHSDLQQTRSHHRIVIKKLIEIPQTKKQQSTRMLLLHRMILLH